MWYLDSGCARHMTGSKHLLERFYVQKGPGVKFGGDSTASGQTEGYGVITNGRVTFGHVAYVNGIKHNLISVSQLCDAGFKVLFDIAQGVILNQDWEVVTVAPRVGNNYQMDMSRLMHKAPEEEKCFFAQADDNTSWLWHKRLCHLNFNNINKLSKRELVTGIPSLSF